MKENNGIQYIFYLLSIQLTEETAIRNTLLKSLIYLMYNPFFKIEYQQTNFIPETLVLKEKQNLLAHSINQFRNEF